MFAAFLEIQFIIALFQSYRVLLIVPTLIIHPYERFPDISDIFDNYISPNSYFVLNFLADSV
jgi:hypothetical protein